MAQFITTVAGNGIQGYSGDAGPARQASLHGPVRVALDAGGNLYIETDGDGRVRQVNTDGIIHTIAGNGKLGLSGDGGPAALASLHGPYGMAIDHRDKLYLADTGNNRVRVISGVAFPIKVPLSNATPGPKLVDDIEVGTFSSGTGITDWYFELPTDATVSFRFAGWRYSGHPPVPDRKAVQVGRESREPGARGRNVLSRESFGRARDRRAPIRRDKPRLYRLSRSAAGFANGS